MKKQTLKQRKAIRSAAAKKGWDTRIARERREIEESNAAESRAYNLAMAALHAERQATADALDRHGVADWVAPTPPPSLWQRIKWWFA